MKSLNDVAKVYKGEVLKAINPGVPYKPYYKTGSSKAYKTGNLFNQVNSSNNINSMIRMGRDKKSFTFEIDIAPNGAVYGQYVHNGTSKMKKRPYGEIAANSKNVKDAIDVYMNKVVESELETMFESLEDRFLQVGFKVS
jgi:hypothetical protein